MNEPSDTEEWLCRRNIRNFKAQLATASSADQHATLLKLLAEYESRLAALHAEEAASHPPQAPSGG